MQKLFENWRRYLYEQEARPDTHQQALTDPRIKKYPGNVYCVEEKAGLWCGNYEEAMARLPSEAPVTQSFDTSSTDVHHQKEELPDGILGREDIPYKYDICPEFMSVEARERDARSGRDKEEGYSFKAPCFTLSYLGIRELPTWPASIEWFEASAEELIMVYRFVQELWSKEVEYIGGIQNPEAPTTRTRNLRMLMQKNLKFLGKTRTRHQANVMLQELITMYHDAKQD